MGTVTVQGRDELGRLIDVTLTTSADVAPPGPEVVAVGEEGGGAIEVDNTVDAPVEVTGIVAAGATFDGTEVTLRGKDFYAQDDDPGAVGYGAVWKDTLNDVWWTRNATDDGWDASVVIEAKLTAGSASADATIKTVTFDGSAATGALATATGDGSAIVTLAAQSDGSGAGNVNVDAAATGSGDAEAGLLAHTFGVGLASAAPFARAHASGDATVQATAMVDTGLASAGSIATRGGIQAGVAAEVDGTSARLGFNAAAPIAIPEIPASPTEQDIADVLVALGLATQAV